MRRVLILLAVLLVFAAIIVYRLSHPAPVAKSATAFDSNAMSPATQYFLGYDRNEYPGDGALPMLRKSFAYSSYWISNPPGAKSNGWVGKRAKLRELGFGFLVLYAGPETKQLKSLRSAEEKGRADAARAAANAKSEGFARGTVIFLDIEEGGRLAPAYHAYLRAWFDTLKSAGFAPGVYCSGMVADEGGGVTIVTSDDIRKNEAPRDFVYWVYNDFCPPAPGCVSPQTPPAPSVSGVSYAAVWQFAQSPRRKEFTSRCATTYNKDGNCYAVDDAARQFLLDLNTAATADPSAPR